MNFQSRSIECRRFQSEALGGAPDSSGHAVDCVACAELVARSIKLVAVLATRPASPAALLEPGFIGAVYESAIDHSEAGSNGGSIRTAMRQPPPSSGGDVEVIFARAELETTLAVPSTSLPSSLHWSKMRSAVLAGARSEPVVSRRLRRLALVGMAASAMAYVVLSIEHLPSPPEIVFLDLEGKPSIEFVIVRGGILR